MAITVGNSVNSGALAGGTSDTQSFNNNKTDVFALVAIRDTRTAATATATYGGAAMTADKTLLYTDGDTTADLRVYIFRKSSAASGANNGVITLNVAADFWTVWWICADGLSATGQPETTASASADAAAASDPSTSMTTTTPDCLLLDVVYNKSGTDMSAGSGQTIIAQVGTNGGGDRALAAYKIVSAAGSQTSTFTETADDDWAMASAAYKIAAAVTAVKDIISMGFIPFPR